MLSECLFYLARILLYPPQHSPLNQTDVLALERVRASSDGDQVLENMIVFCSDDDGQAGLVSDHPHHPRPHRPLRPDQWVCVSSLSTEREGGVERLGPEDGQSHRAGLQLRDRGGGRK